ncbi:hypothetical protein ACFV4K_02715 [Nocardia sp. NPDC059764]|uniref:hypothetical protein n=1 Tax=Nocardia sp. NPDC059764 TaxID=3346939 RepID=UPI00364AFDBC
MTDETPSAPADTRAATESLVKRLQAIWEEAHAALRGVDPAGADRVVEMLVAAAQEIQAVGGSPRRQRGEGDY